jgi:hypothetical protein
VSRLRIVLVALVLAPFAVAAARGAPAVAPACAAPAATVDARLPAPVTVRTGCGVFRIDRDAHVRLLSRETSPVSTQAFAYWPNGVWEGRIAGHLAVGRGQRTLWRSHALFTGRHALYDLSNVVLGPRSLAYSRGFPRQRLYVAPLRGRERLVARGEYPIGWTRGGFYTWGRPHHRLLLRAADGRLRATIARTVYAYAYSGRSLWLIRNGRVLHAIGSRVRRVAALRAIGLWPARHLQLLPLGRLVALEHGRRLVVLHPNGSLFASTTLTYGSGQADGVSASPTENHAGTAVAFATSRGDTGYASRGQETIWLLQAHDRGARPVRVERVTWQTCISGAELSWHGGWLLYAANAGQVALVEAGSGRTIALTPLIRRLPGLHRSGRGLDVSVAWG